MLDYTNANWLATGHQHFSFLCRHGLQPHHRVLDVGCGNLRTGIHLLRYLEPGNYWGIEPHDFDWSAVLDHHGVTQEPYVLRNSDFWTPPNRRFDAVFAQSLLTHLDLAAIARFFRAMAGCLEPGGRIFASHHPATEYQQSGPHPQFRMLELVKHPTSLLRELAAAEGFGMSLCQDWSHPGGLLMGMYGHYE